VVRFMGERRRNIDGLAISKFLVCWLVQVGLVVRIAVDEISLFPLRNQDNCLKAASG
jgi:hypothetical protein